MPERFPLPLAPPRPPSYLAPQTQDALRRLAGCRGDRGATLDWCYRLRDFDREALVFDDQGIFLENPDDTEPRCYPGVFDPPETLEYPGLDQFFEDGDPPWGQPRDVYDFEAIHAAVEAYEAEHNADAPTPGDATEPVEDTPLEEESP